VLFRLAFVVGLVVLASRAFPYIALDVAGDERSREPIALDENLADDLGRARIGPAKLGLGIVSALVLHSTFDYGTIIEFQRYQSSGSDKPLPFGKAALRHGGFSMIIKMSAIAVAAVALTAVLGSTNARAQESCPGLYSRMMGIYQADPYSPAYAQMLPYYNSRCLSGASYQSPQPYPAYSQYPQPTPYGYYGAPQVDPGAAILGAAIVGGTIAAVDSNRGRDDWGDRRWRR